MTEEEEARLRGLITGQPQIRALFTAFLDKLDAKPMRERSQRLFFPVERSPVTALTAPQEAASDQVHWDWIQSLQHAGLLAIQRRRRQKMHQAPWVGAELVFVPESEERIREWLDRPVTSTEGKRWRQACERAGEAFASVETAARRPLRPAGLDEAEAVERLTRIPQTIVDTPMTVRQLSARLFQGDSKCLDGREEWLAALFPNVREHIIERPILIEAHLPAGVEEVLLVENLDSYLHALEGGWPGTERTALVYVAGFRGTNERLRNPRWTRFHWSDTSVGEAERDAFKAKWHRDGEPLGYPVYFFGDLDWSGMAMLARLSHRLPGIRAWQPGYEALHNALIRGEGHPPSGSSKGDQLEVSDTGDPWANEVLLPALRNQMAYVDQEY